MQVHSLFPKREYNSSLGEQYTKNNFTWKCFGKLWKQFLPVEKDLCREGG